MYTSRILYVKLLSLSFLLPVTDLLYRESTVVAVVVVVAVAVMVIQLSIYLRVKLNRMQPITKTARIYSKGKNKYRTHI
jgi:heme/copper-type cytochrome/quinol oxidase subunit 4